MRLLKGSRLLVSKKYVTQQLKKQLTFNNPVYGKIVKTGFGSLEGVTPVFQLYYESVKGMYKIPRYAFGTLQGIKNSLPKIPIAISFKDTSKLNSEQHKSIISAVNFLRKEFGCILSAKAGEGKCQRWDSLIYLPDGSCKTIKQVVEDRDRYVLSYDESSKKYMPKKVISWINSGCKEQWEIVLRSGKKIYTTYEHKFLLEDDRWLAIQGGLGVGDYVHSVGKYNYKLPKYDRTNNSILLLALMIAEGRNSHGQSVFSSNDKYIVDIAKKISKEYKVPLKKLNRYDYSFRNDRKGTDRENKITSFLESVGLLWCKAEDKFIPDEIYKYSDAQLRIFISMLFDTDGSVYNGKRSGIEYCSVSEKLVQGLQTLLLRFGIYSSYRFKKNKKQGAYILDIDGEMIDIFINEFKLMPRKQKILNSLVGMERNSNILTYKLSDLDRELLLSAIKSYGVGKFLLQINRKYSNRYDLGSLLFTKNNRITAQRLIKYCKILRLINLKNKVSNSYFEKIISIRKIGRAPMYDLEIQGSHNFVCNNILVHNTLMAIRLITMLKVKTIIFVQKDKMIKQWRNALLSETDLKTKDIGLLKQGKFIDGKVVIASQQSLYTKTFGKEINNLFSFKIQDEWHKIGGEKFLEANVRFNSRYELGLSATPNREDGLDKLCYYFTSKNIIKHKRTRTVEANYRVYYYKTAKKLYPVSWKPYRIQMIESICEDDRRNNFITDIVKRHKDRSIVLLGERTAQLKAIMELVSKAFPNKKCVRYFDKVMISEKRTITYFRFDVPKIYTANVEGKKIELDLTWVNRYKTEISGELSIDGKHFETFEKYNVDNIYQDKKHPLRHPLFLLRKKKIVKIATDEYTEPTDKELDEADYIFATQKKMTDAVDIPHLDTILYTTPFASDTTTSQSKGRVERLFEGKHFPLVIDIVDLEYNSAIGMYKKREKLYKSVGMKKLKVKHAIK